MELIRADGQKIKLTEDEMQKVYEEYRMNIHFTDWIRSLLEENDYPEQDDQTIADMTEIYVDMMEGMPFGDRLGELEHEAFNRMMREFYPDIKYKEE